MHIPVLSRLTVHVVKPRTWLIAICTSSWLTTPSAFKSHGDVCPIRQRKEISINASLFIVRLQSSSLLATQPCYRQLSALTLTYPPGRRYLNFSREDVWRRALRLRAAWPRPPNPLISIRSWGEMPNRVSMPLVAYWVSHGARGIAAQRALSLARCLPQHDCQVHVLTPRNPASSTSLGTGCPGCCDPPCLVRGADATIPLPKAPVKVSSSSRPKSGATVRCVRSSADRYPECKPTKRPASILFE